MAKVSADRGIALSERKRLSLDRGILAAFLIAGCASIVALKVFPSTIPTWIRIGVPVALICLYASLTIFRTRFRLRFDQAADNCYYMGFIYTLTSLGLALYQIREGSSAQEYGVGIVRDFGLALSTTVVGIILRVAMSQIREDPHDIEEATRRELTDYSRALSGQMRGAVRMLIDVREETEDQLKNFAFEMAQVVKEHQAQVADLRDATQRLANSVNAMAEDLASTEIPTGKLRDATAATLAAVGHLSAALEVASSALGRVDVEARNTATSHERTAAASANAASEGRPGARRHGDHGIRGGDPGGAYRGRGPECREQKHRRGGGSADDR
jgi:hypothetical protein